MSAPSRHAASRGREASIIVFAKAPRAGLVKTRMTPPLSPEEAAELYARMLEDILAATADFARQLDLSAVVAVYPADACREFAQRVPSPFRVIAQRGRDLAERMAWAAAEAAAGGASRILLRSSDSPIIGQATVEQALAALEERADVVVCPDLDGGYGLVGMRSPRAGLFDHPMSTPSVLQDTLDNAARLSLRAEVLEPSPDLDTAEDLVELARRRNAECEALCPSTLAFLDERGLWPS